MSIPFSYIVYENVILAFAIWGTFGAFILECVWKHFPSPRKFSRAVKYWKIYYKFYLLNVFYIQWNLSCWLCRFAWNVDEPLGKDMTAFSGRGFININFFIEKMKSECLSCLTVQLNHLISPRLYEGEKF